MSQVTVKLNKWLEQFELAPVFTEEEVEHYLLPVPDVIDSYVVQDPGAGSRLPSPLPRWDAWGIHGAWGAYGA